MARRQSEFLLFNIWYFTCPSACLDSSNSAPSPSRNRFVCSGYTNSSIRSCTRAFFPTDLGTAPWSFLRNSLISGWPFYFLHEHSLLYVTMFYSLFPHVQSFHAFWPTWIVLYRHCLSLRLVMMHFVKATLQGNTLTPPLFTLNWSHWWWCTGQTKKTHGRKLEQRIIIINQFRDGLLVFLLWGAM